VSGRARSPLRAVSGPERLARECEPYRMRTVLCFSIMSVILKKSASSALFVVLFSLSVIRSPRYSASDLSSSVKSKIAAHSFRSATFASLTVPAPDADHRPQL